MAEIVQSETAGFCVCVCERERQWPVSPKSEWTAGETTLHRTFLDRRLGARAVWRQGGSLPLAVAGAKLLSEGQKGRWWLINARVIMVHLFTPAGMSRTLLVGTKWIIIIMWKYLSLSKVEGKTELEMLLLQLCLMAEYGSPPLTSSLKWTWNDTPSLLSGERYICEVSFSPHLMTPELNGEAQCPWPFVWLASQSFWHVHLEVTLPQPWPDCAIQLFAYRELSVFPDSSTHPEALLMCACVSTSVLLLCSTCVHVYIIWSKRLVCSCLLSYRWWTRHCSHP